jgi:hypothetical protein
MMVQSSYTVIYMCDTEYSYQYVDDEIMMNESWIAVKSRYNWGIPV